MRLTLLKWATLLYLCLGTVPAIAQMSERIIIATTDNPPFTSVEQPGLGMVNQLISEVFARSNITVEYIFLPWARALKDTAAGKYDGLSYSYLVNGRSQRFWFSQPLYRERIAVFASADMPRDNWQSSEFLVDKRFGLTRGYKYTAEVLELVERSSLTPSRVNTDLQNLQMLVKGRIDLFPVNSVTANYLLKREFSEQQAAKVIELQPFVSDTSVHLVFPRGGNRSQRLLALFNSGLSRMQKEEQMQLFLRSLEN